MQDNKQFIIDKLIPIVVKLKKLIELECDNFDIAAPKNVKHALLVNTLHGMFCLIMKRSGHPVLSSFYTEITDQLTFEKEILLKIVEEFEKRDNDPLKQSMN
jgi:hypothetical protein